MLLWINSVGITVPSFCSLCKKSSELKNLHASKCYLVFHVHLSNFSIRWIGFTYTKLKAHIQSEDQGWLTHQPILNSAFRLADIKIKWWWILAAEECIHSQLGNHPQKQLGKGSERVLFKYMIHDRCTCLLECLWAITFFFTGSVSFTSC